MQAEFHQFLSKAEVMSVSPLSHLPEIRCIYCLTNLSEPLYIGSTQNLCNRLHAHQKVLAKSQAQYVAYLPCDEQDMLQREIDLIDKYKPKFNIQHTRIPHRQISKAFHQREMAKAIGISDGHLSQILSGIYTPGKRAAKGMSRLTGRPWIDFLDMTPSQIKSELEAASGRANQADPSTN